MNRIEFPRVGYDGISRNQKKFEDIFLKGRILGEIDQSLGDISREPGWSVAEVECVALIRKHLPFILTARPRGLKRIKDVINAKYPHIFDNKKKGGFQKRVLKAFGYNTYRKVELVTLAKWLNIKSCPYCNAQYTLFIDKRINGTYPKGLVKYQFDHFFNKSDAPYLSMSLFNLIPSCASCNLSKHAVDISVELNPYDTDIAELFSFQAKDPVKLWQGASSVDAVQIKLVPSSRNVSSLVKELNGSLFLDKQYGRFADVAQEVYDKAYLYPYYSEKGNFPMLTGNNFDEKYFRQLWLGNYTEKEDIEKRPLAKFMQDLWEQANGVIRR